jgi:hypothetical protein
MSLIWSQVLKVRLMSLIYSQILKVRLMSLIWSQVLKVRVMSLIYSDFPYGNFKLIFFAMIANTIDALKHIQLQAAV